MLKNTEETDGGYLFIESDNAVQYKSCQHFDIIQQICIEQNQPIIRNYGIPDHGKGEVDHVGGIGKTPLRRAIAAGIFLDEAGEMTEYLHEKFKDKEYPQYVIDAVKEEDLEIARENGRLKLYGTINGSSNFRKILFTPFSETIKASPRICICDECKFKYGSCELFTDCFLPITHLKEGTLRSQILAISPSKSSRESIWSMKIISERVAESKIEDDYKHVVQKGDTYIEGRHLEEDGTTRSELKFKLMKKVVFFRKESVVYPFVNFQRKDDTHLVSKQDYCDILHYVDHYGMAAL